MKYHSWLLGASILMIGACSAQAEGAREHIIAFFEAAHRGDLHQQMQALVRKEEQTEQGGRVLRALYPDEDMRHFNPDSAVLSKVNGDTAVWMVWGTAPNFERFEYSATREVAGVEIATTRQPTDAEIAALPRITSALEIRLVRIDGSWRLPLHAAQVGPLLIGMDSLNARCTYGEDPRPCRNQAERLARAADSLPSAARQRFSYLGDIARDKIQEAQAMDSIRLVLVDERSNRFSIYNYIEVAVVNESNIPLGSVWFRILDANGNVLERQALVSDLPAKGREETINMIVGRSFPRPIKLELTHVTLQYESPDRRAK